MATSKDRQRALARAKHERQMARRAAAARRRRQIQAGTAAGLVLIVGVVAAMWASGVFSPSKHKAAAEDCTWTNEPTDNAKDVGRPPTSNIPKSGTETFMITTNRGVISAGIDASKVPCSAASFSYLAGKNFFDNTKCHRLTNSGIFVLQCGDPSGTGKGGPGYHFADENLPEPDPSSVASGSSPSAQHTYPAGALAMANSGPDTNGSQFFVVYRDSPLPAQYTQLGTVTRGLDVVQKIAADGIAPGGASANDGAPKDDVVIQSLTMTAPDTTAGSPSTAGSTP